MQMEDALLHQEQAQELILVLANLTKRMEVLDFSAPITSIFGVQDASWLLSWLQGRLRILAVSKRPC